MIFNASRTRALVNPRPDKIKRIIPSRLVTDTHLEEETSRCYSVSVDAGRATTVRKLYNADTMLRVEGIHLTPIRRY